MSLRSWVLAAAAAGAVALPAAAEAARTTGSVNLRTGPGTMYQVITTLPPGAYVSINRCSGGWCLVNTQGTSGWVSASYVGAGGYRYAAPAPRYYAAPVYPPAVYAYPYAYRYGYPYRAYRGPGYYYPGASYGFYFNFGGGHRW